MSDAITFPDQLAEAPGRLTVSGAPEGVDAFALAHLAEKAGLIVHVARDEALSIGQVRNR